MAPPERCPSITAGELRRSAQASVDWFVRNQNPDGTWLYLYNADDDSTSVRVQPGPPRRGHDGPLPGRRGGTAGRAAAPPTGAPNGRSTGSTSATAGPRSTPDGRIATGTTALLVAGLVIRREATGDTRYDDVLGRLGRFLVAQTQPSGAVLASYDSARGRPVAGEYSKYYTGEAYWALARLHLNFPDEGWGQVADRIGAYLATSRDEVEDHWPPIPDHWAAYGMAETVEFPKRGHPPLTEDEVDYARRQAELFGVQARWVSQRFGPWGGLVRGTYTPRGGGYGVISEALTGWWLAAAGEPRLADLRGAIAERATCIAALAVRAQSDARGRREGRPAGAGGGRVVHRRRDPHGRPAARAGRAAAHDPDRRGSRGSSAGIVRRRRALGLAVGRRSPAGAQPGPGRVRDPARGGARAGAVVGLAAAGGAIGGLVVCVAALAGDPLLDALDVSEPSFRLAAGIVAVLAGAADLFRRPPAARARAARAGAPRSSRSRSQRWRGPRCWCWRWRRAPTSVSSRAPARWRSASRCSPALAAAWPTEGRAAGRSRGRAACWPRASWPAA